MFSKLSLKTKLYAGFCTVLIFTIIISATSSIGMNKTQVKYDYIAKDILSNLEHVYEMNLAFQEANRNLLRIYMVDKVEDVNRNVESYYKNLQPFSEHDKAYRSSPFVDGEAVVYNEFISKLEDYKKEAEIFLTEVRKSPLEKESYKDLLVTNVRNARHKFNESAKALVGFNKKLGADAKLGAESLAKQTSLITYSITAVGLILSIFLAWFFSNSISKMMNQFSKDIAGSASETSAASTQLTSSSSQLSQGATESAASLEETVSSLEELSSMVKLNSDHAKEANSLSQTSLKTAEQGEGDIAKMITVISSMSKSSKKIEEIINVIDDIAFQTNLLALNAAVEAARAGEQGKGFAVVADAVRSLAGRSASAAKDIHSLIKENVEMSVQGEKVAETSGKSLQAIVTSVKKVADLNSEISAASLEQSNGIEQISKAMNHLDQAIQENASASGEVAASAVQLSSQADALNELVRSLQGFVNGSNANDSSIHADNLHALPTKPKRRAA